MAGEEFADLAYAWLELKNDRGAALAIFRQAVPDISVRRVLQNIAITAASEFNNPELALQCYQKTVDIITRELFNVVTTKMVNALDLAALVESVVQNIE